jgi:hypothetical protein
MQVQAVDLKAVIGHSPTNTERSAVWDSMLEADYQKRYWHTKAGSYLRKDRWLQCALAVLSSAAVLSALGEYQLPDLWKLLSFITALFATALPFVNLTRRAISMTDVASRWHLLEVEYSSMWRKVDKGDFSEERFKDLKAQEVEIGKMTSDLPFDDKKTQKSCFEQVLIARGTR